MSIIHTTPRRSGTEGLLKLLDTLTDEIVLSPGKILMGQFFYNDRTALKLSLYVSEGVFDNVGIRNVFIEDIRDTVAVRMGDKKETDEALRVLRQTKDWDQAFPATHRANYRLMELARAAQAVRDFLLFGKLPGMSVSGAFLNMIASPSPSPGYVEFNVLTTLSDCD